MTIRVVLLTCVVANLLGLATGAWSPTATELLLFMIGAATLTPLPVAYLIGRRDIFDPVYISGVVFFVLFFIRPLHDYYSDDFNWVYIDVSQHINVTLSAVLCAIIAYNCGLLLPTARSIISMRAEPRANIDSAKAMFWTWMFLGLAMALRALTVFLQGGVGTLFVRRESLPSTSSNIPIITESIFLIVPVFLLFWQLSERYLVLSRIGMAICALIIFQSFFVGDRRYALVFLVAAVVYYFVKQQRRPRLLPSAALVGLLFFGVLAPIELSRGEDLSVVQALQRGVTSPGVALQDLLLESQSTSMVNAFAVIVEGMEDGRDYGFRYGLSTVTETLLQPLPRFVWPSKPQSIRTVVISEQWGFSGGGCVSLCPTFSALGTFYSDLGVLGLLLGSFVSGLLIRLPLEYLNHDKTNGLGQIVFSGLVLSPLFLWWSSLGAAVVISGMIILPVIVVNWRASSGLAPVSHRSPVSSFPAYTSHVRR